MKDYGTDVERFNAEHNHTEGCSLGRLAGSDYTECSTHYAVPEILRGI